MLHQLRLVVSFSHYLQGFVHPRWCSPDFWTINSISVKTAIFLEGFTVNHVRGDHDYTFDGLPLDIQTHGEDRYEWTPIHISWDEKPFGVQSSHLQTTGMTRGWLGCLGSGFHENVFLWRLLLLGDEWFLFGTPKPGLPFPFQDFSRKPQVFFQLL